MRASWRPLRNCRRAPRPNRPRTRRSAFRAANCPNCTPISRTSATRDGATKATLRSPIASWPSSRNRRTKPSPNAPDPIYAASPQPVAAAHAARTPLPPTAGRRWRPALLKIRYREGRFDDAASGSQAAGGTASGSAVRNAGRVRARLGACAAAVASLQVVADG